MTHREERQARRAALREQFGELYDTAIAMFYRHDLIELAHGTNEDEYEAEVMTILPRLVTEAESVANVQAIIYDEFSRWFEGSDLLDPPEKYAGLAGELWVAYSRWRSRSPKK